MAHRYPDDFDPAKRCFGVLAPDYDYPLSSKDLNAAQSALAWRTRSLGDALFQDGNVVRGGAIRVDVVSGEARLEAAAVYLDGMVHEVPAAVLVIPLGRRVRVGVCLTEDVVTHLEDPGLVLDVIGAEDYGEPTAHRRRITVTWACDAGDGVASGCDGRFYGVYVVDRGTVIDQTPPPQFDPLNAALARYDREANGHYIVSGWQVRALGPMPEGQVFSVGEGTVNVWGYKISRDTALRLVVPEAPDLDEVEAEPHQVPSNAFGDVVIAANHTPIIDIRGVTVIRERTVTVTHGPYSGAIDALPDTSVAEVIQVKQGTTTFTQGTDYDLSADRIDWQQAGAEPAPGSTYQATYRYLDTGMPKSWDANGVTVSGVVSGTTVILAYRWALPRIDAINVDRAGNVHYLKGLPSRYEPWAPATSSDQLAVAHVVNRWGQTPLVRNVGTRAVHNNLIELYGILIYDLFDLVANERLKRDMDARQPTTKRGVFTDPFLDDDMRDQGIAQTGAIVGGALRLPINGRVTDLVIGSAPILLPYVEEVVLTQDFVTDCHRINPYQAFEPLPARVRLDPAVDVWTEHETAWTSAITERFLVTENRTVTSTINARGSGRRITLDATEQSSTVSRSELTGVSREDDAIMRVRNVSFAIDGFGAGEILAHASFDGVDVTATIPGFPLSADADGHIEGAFRIPSAIPSGTKQVAFEGRGGTSGSAAYAGNGVIVTEIWRNVFTTTVRRLVTTNIVTWAGGDPVAQSFALAEGRHITGVSVKFCAIGDRNKPVALLVRRTDNGVPIRETLGESVLDMKAVGTGAWTKLPIPSLPFLAADERYANVLMTDDAKHAVAVATMGGFDAAKQRYVSAQPYQVGVFFDGSIDEAWKPYHDKDMTFRIHAARFTDSYRKVFVGTVRLVECSDLIVACGYDEPTKDCSVIVLVTRANGEVIRALPDQNIRFDSYLSEEVRIDIELHGTDRASPILYPFVQVVEGSLRQAGDYVSRALPADPGANVNVVVTFDCLLPSGSDIAVSVGGTDAWQPATLHAAEPLGDGWQERSYKLEDYRALDARLRLQLTGNARARPLVRNLRANVTSDPVNIISGS